MVMKASNNEAGRYSSSFTTLLMETPCAREHALRSPLSAFRFPVYLLRSPPLSFPTPSHVSHYGIAHQYMYIYTYM